MAQCLGSRETYLSVQSSIKEGASAAIIKFPDSSRLRHAARRCDWLPGRLGEAVHPAQDPEMRESWSCSSFRKVPELKSKRPALHDFISLAFRQLSSPSTAHMLGRRHRHTFSLTVLQLSSRMLAEKATWTSQCPQWEAEEESVGTEQS